MRPRTLHHSLCPPLLADDGMSHEELEVESESGPDDEDFEDFFEDDELEHASAATAGAAGAALEEAAAPELSAIALASPRRRGGEVSPSRM